MCLHCARCTVKVGDGEDVCFEEIQGGGGRQDAKRGDCISAASGVAEFIAKGRRRKGGAEKSGVGAGDGGDGGDGGVGVDACIDGEGGGIEGGAALNCVDGGFEGIATSQSCGVSPGGGWSRRKGRWMDRDNQSRGPRFVSWIMHNLMPVESLRKGSGVMDVAGGSGQVSFELAFR